MTTTTKTQRTVLTTQTWLPVFNGFYNTILGDRLELTDVIYDINQDRKSKELSEVEYSDLEVDHETASQNFSEDIFKSITKELTKRNLINGAVFEKLHSPKYYNYSNDSINCTFKFSKENIETIKNYLKDNETKWKEYLKDNFTSCDGFSSHYDNESDSEDWKDVKECLSHNFKGSSILEFILLNEEYTCESVYYDTEFYMSSFITNYNELLGE